MKKLLLSLIFVSSIAQAETWMIPNRNGGGIYVTDRVCHDKRFPALKEGYAIADGGRVLRFCWIISDGMVKAIYDDGSEYFYSAKTFSKVQ